MVELAAISSFCFTMSTAITLDAPALIAPAT
jgi:hypothetical protein